MKHKKIFAVVCALVLIICFFAGLPEEQMSAESSGSLSDVAGVYIDADYSTCTLTAVLTDADGNDIYVEDENISYAWYKSSEGTDGSYDEINGETGSTLGASFIDGYYYKVKVTVNGGMSATYTSEVKYITTKISSVKIQNDIYRDDVLTALLLNSEGDVLYYDADGNSSVPTATPTSATPSDATTYNRSATYTWYRYSTAAGATVYTDPPTDTIKNDGAETAAENTNENKLTPTMGKTSYYYYVTVTVDENNYTSETRIADVYDGISVEIEQVKANDSNDITLKMIVYDDNGDVMLNEDGSYYYNSAYTTTWYKSKEYFASTGDGTTADENSKVETSATIPLGYAPQDYYTNSNYMRVTNAAYNASTNTVGYTNTLTVSDEVGRYYYVDINKNKTNGSAEAGANPVFVRNCKSTVVVEDHIAEDGTFKAVVYDADGNQVTNTDSYTYTWYKTVSGTTNYVNDKDKVKTSNSGTFVSTYSSDNSGSYTTSAYYSDSGKFTRNSGTSTNKTSEYGGTLPYADTYGLVRENFSEELQAVKDVFADANYKFDTSTNSTNKFEITDSSGSLNDGSSCSVAVDEGQLRYYYVTIEIDNDTTYTSSYKYVKYSNQIENGGFQDYTNTSDSSSAFEASIMPYWETTNKGYSESYKATSSTNEQYYRMHPLLEIGNYLSSTSYGTYGNYYSYPGLTYDKDDSTKIQTSTLDNYYEMGYDDDSTTDYVYNANQFCEINSTDSNTLYQTVMTIPDMPLYWSLTHHARTSYGKSTTITNSVVYKDNNDKDVKVTDLGATSATVQVAIDVMYVVIMNETDAEDLLSNGDTQAAQQDIIDAMVLYITTNYSVQVIQTSEDGSSYLERYDGSYTYSGKTYSNISVWRVQTGSTKVTLTFGTDSTAKDKAEAAASDTNLLAYYAEKYGTVKSYSYSSSSTSNGVTTTTYYAGFYTESETYSATYDIPDGQYVSRYFFVAGSSSNSVGAGSASSAYSDGGLTFGTYTDDDGNTQTISDYNDVTKATNGASAGNFIDNVVFSQQLDVTVNYWVYQPVEVTTTDENGNEVTTTEWKYVLQTADTEESKTMRDSTVTAEKAGDYYDKYNFTGSYVSVDGGDENTPTSVDEDGNSVLGTATSFKADADNALTLDLYYSPYEISIDKTIVGLPEDMSYESFKDNMLKITIYALEEDGSGGYTKADSAVVDEYLEYNEKDESLTYSTGFILEKGTYLISETTYLLLTASFEGWNSVEMSLANGTLKLGYSDSLDGYILVVGEESDEADGDTDAEIEILLLNIYEPVAVQSTKSVLLGETKVEDINNGLGSTDPGPDTSLTYLSLTEYDDAKRSVDDTGYTEDSERLGVLSGDTLTYRMELASTGRADSEDIVVTDIIPSGCTLQADSICILKQDRKDATNSYSVVKTILDSSGSGSTEDGVTTWSMTDNSSVSFKITYNKTTGEIEWNISEMDAYEQYYVEYAVTVDQIKSSTERELLTNTAKWTYLSKINSGETENSSTTVEVTMDMKAEKNNITSGKYAYTVTFSDLGSYTVTELKDSLPDGFVIDTGTIKINSTSISDLTNYKLTYYKANGAELSGTLGTDYQASEIASFAVTYSDGISKSTNNKITLTFEGTQTETENAGEEIRNTAGISYVKTGEDTVYTSIVAYGNGITNQVETDVTHLYIEVEKDIVSDANLTVDTASTDEEQTFLFVVKYYEEGSDPAEDAAKSISYVEVNCESGKGSSLLQLDRRGTYVVTEVTDWSVTDYDYVSASLDGAATSSSNSSSVTIDYTNGGAYIEENGAFKTTLGLVNESHAVASFYNMESLYAYRSGQAYAKNKMEDSD